MKPARYIFLNQGLAMSAGKCAAQAAHAETLAMHDFHSHSERVYELDPEVKAWLMRQDELYEIWYGDGHYAKYVMKAKDSTQMFTIERYLNDAPRLFKTYMVVDEGHTEDTYMVPTALAVELVDKDDERTASIFNTFRMYKEKRPTATPEKKGLPILRRLRGKA